MTDLHLLFLNLFELIHCILFILFFAAYILTKNETSEKIYDMLNIIFYRKFLTKQKFNE
jgi:hypothetical protein